MQGESCMFELKLIYVKQFYSWALQMQLHAGATPKNILGGLLGQNAYQMIPVQLQGLILCLNLLYCTGEN